MFTTLRRRLPARVVWTPGLNRFAEAQALSGAADALVAVSLAGSLFFSLSPDASREQVLLYLLINMAPFALLAPLIGPAIDGFRFGHRWIAVFLFVLPAICPPRSPSPCSTWPCTSALALLVSAKASGVVRQALVPALVDEPDQLVGANSRLARLTVIAGGIGGALGAAVLAVTGSPAITLGLACATFVLAALATLRLPQVARVDVLIASVEYGELHTPTIVNTASAWTLVHAVVGFFVFGLAFALRRESEPAWMYGAASPPTAWPRSPATPSRPSCAAATARTASRPAPSSPSPSSPPSVPWVRPDRSCCWCPSCSAALRRLDARASTRRRDPGPRRLPRPGVRPLRDPVPARLGRRGHRRRRRAIPTRFSLAIVALALIPAAVLYVRALREAHEAHIEDPFDPVEVARRRSSTPSSGIVESSTASP